MTKQDLQEKVELYKDQILFLKEQLDTVREEKEQYRQQVERLQDAIINIKAPEAYLDMKRDMSAIPEISKEEIEKRQRMQEVQDQYIRSIEEPLFRNGDDLDLMIKSGLAKDAVSSEDISIHGNDES